MKRYAKQFRGVTRLTALEAMRQPICLILATCSVVMMALFPLVITHTLGESGKLVRDSALATQFVLGLALGAYAASSTLVREIKRGTVSSVLAKPVHREVFILAKFAGVFLVMALFSLMSSMATLVSARGASQLYAIDWWACGPLLAAPFAAYLAGALINYTTRRPFVSNAFFLLFAAVSLSFLLTGFLNSEGHLQTFGRGYAWKIVPACLLVGLAVLVLQGIAVGLATRFEAVPTLCLCSLMFLVGLMTDYLLGRHAATSGIAQFLYRMLPNWQHFWMADALTGEQFIPWAYVGAVLRYTALYLAGTLCLAFGAFRLIDIK